MLINFVGTYNTLSVDGSEFGSIYVILLSPRSLCEFCKNVCVHPTYNFVFMTNKSDMVNWLRIVGVKSEERKDVIALLEK